MIGAVTDSKATVSGKNPYTIGPLTDSMCIYVLTFDQALLNVYLNGELIVSTPKLGSTRYLENIYFGGDYNGGSWFKGLMPTISFYNSALGDTDRNALTNWLADRWLPSGTELGNGHIANSVDTIKPTISGAFLDFDSEGLVLDGSNRVTSWNDSTALGTNRVATVQAGTFGIQTIKGKNALYFDNMTNMKVPILDTTANHPSSITVALVVKFDNFLTSGYTGSGNQTLFSSADSAAIRAKNFVIDGELTTRFGTDASSYTNVGIPASKFLSREVAGSNANVKVQISKDLNFNTVIESTLSVANPLTNQGTTLHNFTGLESSTKYNGRFIVDGIPESGNLFSFKTLSSTNKSFKIITGSCNFTGSNAVTWDRMLEENADLFVHMGDLHYENVGTGDPHDYSEATDLALASPKMSNFFKNQAMAYMADNHDSIGVNPTKNDDFTQFIPFYDRNFPHYTFGSNTPVTDSIYFSWNMGRVKCIMTNNRTHRDPIQTVDSPTKTTLGTVQKAWLKSELLAAKNAGQSIIWFSGICYVADVQNPLGMSFLSGGMSWGSYPTEQKEIANYIYDNQIKNVTIVSGDSHMQAMDDGRNAIFSTDEFGVRRQYSEISEEYLIPNLCASPFDQDVEFEGGPYQINSSENSGNSFTSRDKSYGVLEVVDKGENWIQFKFRMMGYNPITTLWEANEYVYNRVMAGPVGIPPAKYLNVKNQKGYVGDSNEWKRIADRHIGVDGNWKSVSKKYIGINGYWKMSYNSDELDLSSVFYVSSLQGYTLNPDNVLEIYGSKFLDSQFVSPKTGGHFELKQNYSDVFENITSGNAIGVNSLFGETDNIKSWKITGPDTYFQLSPSSETGFNSRNLVGADGKNDGIFAMWAHIPTLGVKRFLFHYGTDDDYGSMYVGVDNKVYLEFKQLGITQTFGSLETVSVGWNKFVYNRKGLSAAHTFIYLAGVKLTIDFTGLVIPPATVTYPIKIGAGITGGLVNSAINCSFANVYVKSRSYASPTIIEILKVKPTPEVVLKNTTTLVEYTIPSIYVGGITNTSIGVTIPKTDVIPLGEYNLFVRSVITQSSNYMINIVAPEVETQQFIDDFSDPKTLTTNYYKLNKAWGGANGGVVTENVFIRGGELIIKGNGDLYSGTQQGVDRETLPKFHTHPDDPKLGQPWTNRVGGCVVYNKRTGFGRYEVEAFIPNNLGVAYAIWTFFYNEVYPTSLNYPDMINVEGLHQQGTVEDGFYVTRNHEIDIEFPSHLDGGVLSDPSLSNMKCNTWRGELKNWDVPITDPSYWEEYRDNLTPVGFNIADGQYHTLRYDWHFDRVEFYIDGVLKRTNTNTVDGPTIPDIPGFFTFGLWFPSSPLPAKPWLVNPTRAWGGGVLDVDGGMKANFDSIEMKVRKFSFTPFSDEAHLQRNLGETYPFGGYRKDAANN